jgi:hypothetical protein
MNLEDFGVLLEDLVNAQRRLAVALEDLVALGQVFVEATVMAATDDDEGA